MDRDHPNRDWLTDGLNFPDRLSSTRQRREPLDPSGGPFLNRRRLPDVRRRRSIDRERCVTWHRSESVGARGRVRGERVVAPSLSLTASISPLTLLNPVRSLLYVYH